MRRLEAEWDNPQDAVYDNRRKLSGVYAGHVVLVPFPYRDQLAERTRPAVVVFAQSYNQQGDLVIAAVTSQAPRFASDYALQDWAAADQPRPHPKDRGHLRQKKWPFCNLVDGIALMQSLQRHGVRVNTGSHGSLLRCYRDQGRLHIGKTLAASQVVIHDP